MVKSKRKKNERKKENIRQRLIYLLIFTVLYAVFLMWSYGNVNHYFPEPIHVGLGQYFDLSIGIIILGTTIYMALAGIFYKKIININKNK